MSEEEAPDAPAAIRLTVPQRYYLLPGAAIILGTTIGLLRGSRTASLRFLAENVHRPPTTVKGWYFYNKTKNYRIMLGGLKEAGSDAVKLGATAAGWVAMEEGCTRLGIDDVGEVVAGLGTAGVFSLAYRLPWKVTRRTLMLGLLMGCTIRALRWSQDKLKREAQVRMQVQEVAAAAAEGREEVLEDLQDVTDEMKNLAEDIKGGLGSRNA